jgi:ribonuclease P protein component
VVALDCLSFSKSKRLLVKRQFDSVLDGGIKVVCKDFVLVASKECRGEQAESRLGLIVSKKVGDAVQRTRVKRCVREVFRTQEKLSLAGRDLVVIARPTLNSGDGKIVRDVTDSFKSCFERMKRTLSSKSLKPKSHTL